MVEGKKKQKNITNQTLIKKIRPEEQCFRENVCRYYKLHDTTTIIYI